MTETGNSRRLRRWSAARQVLLCGLAAGVVAAAHAAPEDTNMSKATTVHSVSDLSHEFSFYTDGRFFSQYLQVGQNQDARNWGTLSKCNLSNVNLLVLMSGATPCPYPAEDVAAVRGLLAAGGGVAVLGNYGTFRDEKVYQLNALAEAFGAAFSGEPAKRPFSAAAEFKVDKVENYGGGTITLSEPAEWAILVRDAAGKVLMARRAVGRGQLLVASRALFGHRPDAKDPINAEWVGPLLRGLARNKPVDPSRPPTAAGWAEFDNVVKHGSLELHFSDYCRSEADAIVAIYDRCVPTMQEMLGVPPSEGMMSALLLLPTGGGGFSSGHRIGLGIWWGGFPDREYGMIELIGHEGTHAWVLPFAEPMWNEPLATYVGALLGERLGYPAEGKHAIDSRIAGARKYDPEMKICDIAYGKDIPNAVYWGKSMWLWEQMRAEHPDILSRYFRAKRKLAKPSALKRYTPDDCIAVLSHAMERDMFPFFRAHGLSVSPEKAKVPLFGAAVE